MAKIRLTAIPLILLAVGAISFVSYISALAADESLARSLSGRAGVYVEGNRGHRSPSIRQDWDLTTDFDLSYGEPTAQLWRYDLTARITSDLDGRRPANEPGIYNGIQETFQENIQPWLYRASAFKNFTWTLGPLSEPAVKLGRQYRSEGDFLWFDGADIKARWKNSGANLEISGFGGIPVRLYGSATDDWVAGLGLQFRLSRAFVSAEAYHISDHRRGGAIERDNVARISLRSPIGKSVNVFVMGRATESEGLEFRANALWRTGFNDISIRGDLRLQSQDRGSLSTELDAASAIHGRAIGAPRRAFHEIGLAASIPYRDWLVFDVGGSTRETRTTQDRYNLNFDRLYSSLSIPSLPIFRKVSGSVTFDAYESAGDYTRSVSGEVSTNLSDRIRGSLGTSYALYSYDYTTLELKDDVRSITGRLDWRYRDDLRFEGRYDGEYDDARLHHYLKLGARYEL